MFTVRIADEPESAKAESLGETQEDPLLEQVAQMYRDGVAWKTMRKELKIGFKRQKKIIDRAFELGLITERRGSTWGLRRGPVSGLVSGLVREETEVKKQTDTVISEAEFIVKRLKMFEDQELRMLYAEIEREMGRRTLQEGLQVLTP